MKFCAYMTICLWLPFVLGAAEAEQDEAEKASEEDTAAANAAASDPGFERFKTILDRMPFGQPPPGFNPDAPGGAVVGPHGAAATAEEQAAAAASEVEQQIQSSVSVSMLNRSPDGSVFVGFTDKSVQPPRNYLLKVGEKREGCEWLVVSAEPEDRLVKLSKGGVEATLKLGGGGPVDEKGKEGADAAKGTVVRPGPGLGLKSMPSHSAAGEGAAGNVTGLDIARARRQERLKQQQAEAEQQRQAAEQEKKDREQAQREREQAAEERKAQFAQLMQIQEELRAAREEKQAEAERRAAEEAQRQAERQAAEGAQPQEGNQN